MKQKYCGLKIRDLLNLQVDFSWFRAVKQVMLTMRNAVWKEKAVLSFGEHEP